MDSTEFSLTYDGERLHAEPMSAKTLAPVLAATAQLFEIIHRQYDVFDDHVPQVRVRRAEPGSFTVLFELTMVNIDDVVDFLTTREVQAAATLAGIGTPLVGMFMKVIDRFKNKGNEKVEDISSKEHAEDQRLQALCDSLAKQKVVHRQVKEIVKPVTAEGVDTVAIESPVVEAPIEVDKQQATAIVESFEEDEDVSVSIEEWIVRVATPHLDNPLARKWRLLRDEDDYSFMAKMLDADFAEDVLQDNVDVKHGSRFKAKIHAESRIENGKAVRPQYQVLRMVPLDSGPDEQYELNLGGSDSE
ncbi:hypothetical protein HW450_03670 [Corynebacterium hindlerae]|uniref:Uncharacterized protein n=1 Tax=Corynebacterium hindlerae TaxID=699041 RepID=A0A7G5FGV2_9CORY|nr:hypothetical protein [Corynebacterium hindlerae]QMV85843.1 hypothetical protein HW450_03670 [Corynebacterium hindlerae]